MRRSRNFEAVAERTVDDVSSPMFRKPLDVGKVVHQAGGGQDPTSDDRVPPDKVETEAVLAGASHRGHPAGEDLAAVAAHLLTAGLGDHRRSHTLTAEIAVHVGGRRSRGSPASTTITDQRWRPSCNAAARPAADPPTMATSQCRSTVRGAKISHGFVRYSQS